MKKLTMLLNLYPKLNFIPGLLELIGILDTKKEEKKEEELEANKEDKILGRNKMQKGPEENLLLKEMTEEKEIEPDNMDKEEKEETEETEGKGGTEVIGEIGDRENTEGKEVNGGTTIGEIASTAKKEIVPVNQSKKMKVIEK